MSYESYPLLSKIDALDTTRFEYRPEIARGGMEVAESLSLSYTSLVLLDTPSSINGWNESWVDNSQFGFRQLKTPFSLYKQAGSDTLFAIKDEMSCRFLLTEE